MTSHLHIPKLAPTIPKLPDHPRSQKRFPVDPHNNRVRRPMDYSTLTQTPGLYSLQKRFTPPSFLRKTLDIPPALHSQDPCNQSTDEEVQMKLPVPQPVLQFRTPHIKFLVLCMSWGVFGKVSPCPDSSWEAVTNHKISSIPLWISAFFFFQKRASVTRLLIVHLHKHNNGCSTSCRRGREGSWCFPHP
jgi:hypothetical protein